MKLKDQFSLNSSIHIIILILVLAMTSCIGGKLSNGRKSLATSNSTGTNGTGGTAGNGAISDTTTTDSTTISSQKIELSHLVDPFTGTYKKKITVPKNYKGYMYIAGLNLSALSGKIIKVRLNFGIDRQSIVLGATLARAPGITPKTDIQVLVLDLNKRPFQDMRLPYDLYDYNEYNSDSTLEPVTNPLDGGLYCRGVRLADDPTFIVSTDGDTCKDAEDKCLYSYAKIEDAAFYNLSTGLTTTPTKPGVWANGTVLDSSQVSGMCLADNSYANFISNFSMFIPSGYTYSGPYRPINQSSWYISSNALFGSVTSGSITNYHGLFETGTASDKTSWYRSLLFPRAGTLNLNSNVNYFGSTSKFGTRGSMVSDSTGTTKYVDGCNIRAMNYETATNEGIGSCNVSATIDVYYMSGTSEVSITSTNSLKLQLSRASLTNSEGAQVLSSSFKSCESSTTCGADECCYNNRCWSKDLVSQCVDDVAQTGNREIGTSCTSDYQCASLCCDSSTGACAAHNPTAATPVLCSKQSGQNCVAKEFCAKEYVPVCKLYKNGYNADGTVKCTIRCPTVATYGSCVAGACVAPKGQTDTSAFNLTTCEGALDP
jgi:hypothetical protein